MSTPIVMPQLGETLIEGTLLRWLKQEGETVQADEPLIEISTDKVDTEVPAPASGTLTQVTVGEGETVPVGMQLAVIESDPAVAAAAASGSGSGARADAVPASSDLRPETPGADLPATEEAGGEATTEHPSTVRMAAAGFTPPSDAGPRAHILSPLVRRLATEHGVDLGTLVGTGAGGRITKKDVLAAAGSSPGTQAPPGLRLVPQAAPGAREEIVPLGHVRKAIAQHMSESLRTSARAWTMVDVDLERIAKLRAVHKEAFREREGAPLTYLPFLARATCEALLAHPEVNAKLQGEDLVLPRYVNLGIAVAYDDGLIVPVIRDAMNLTGLARSIADLAARARSHQLAPAEVEGATFTITNPGPYGSIMSVPIINQPNAAILSFDAVEKRPVVIDDAIAIRHRVYLSMSWDHRIIDGALATQFLVRVKEHLETWDFAEDLGTP